MTTPLDHALAYLRGGISLLPIGKNGDKLPAFDLLPLVWDAEQQKDVRSWNPLREQAVNEETARQWWGRSTPVGMAAVCGAISGGLEVIDFDRDAATIFPVWSEMVEEESPGILERVSIVRTPRQPAGYHVWFRCGGIETPGNEKLASLTSGEESDAKRRVLIETRGEGGYALVPGCPPECHETNRPYEHHAGMLLCDLHDVSMEERDTLIACARYFDRQEVKTEPIPPSRSDMDLRPGDDFDRNGWDWGEILGPCGWVMAAQVGSERRWRRPDKERGWSATTGHCKDKNGADLLRVFSDNAEPFAVGAYGKFRAYALLACGGDLSQAARQLRGHGFGKGKPGVKVPGASAAAPPPDNSHRKVATIHDLALAGAEVRWLWEGWVPSGVLTAVAAEGGTGKTRWAADLTRRIRCGLPWPDGQPMTLPPDSVALWVVSDNHHDEMVSLTRSFGIVDSVRINAWSDDPYGGVTLEAEEDLRELEQRIAKVKPVMVVIDTVGNATDKNLSRQEDAKAFYQPLQVIARRHRCAVLCLTHLNATGKFLGRRVLEKVRVAIRMAKPQKEDARRRLEVTKTNSKVPPPLGVTMGDGGNEYDTNPPEEPTEGFDEPGFQRSGGGKLGRPASGSEKAIAWLARRLASGPARVSITRDEAEKAGIAGGALYRAKDALGIEQFETEGYKWWELPSSDG